MRITDPGERACDADRHRDVRQHAHNEDRVVVILVVDENEGHPEYEPHKAGGRATRVDAAQMLQR